MFMIRPQQRLCAWLLVWLWPPAGTISTALAFLLPTQPIIQSTAVSDRLSCGTQILPRRSLSRSCDGCRVVTTTTTSGTSSTRLYGGVKDHDDHEDLGGGLGNQDDDNDDEQEDRVYRDALTANRIRTDVRIFLTQRAIQSFLFLLASCRDPHTGRWLESTYGCTNLNSYHGTGAFNLTQWGTWDRMLLDMLTRPKQVVIISARRRGRGHGGWSKNNPYLEERFVDFEIDIDPPSLVSRIISVREQIAEEWAMDLDTMRTANDLVLASYHDRRRASRDEEEECIRFDHGDDKDVFASDQDDCIRIEALGAAGDDRQPSQPSPRAFDRAGPLMLSHSITFDEQMSSPYRKGNFDLLCLLATQESVHRVLRQYRKAQDTREISYRWLREFYVSRIETHFDGNQPYGRADDFLEDLLLAPPAVRDMGLSANNKQKMGLVDPLRIADDIIKARSQVATDWKQVMLTVSQDHMQLRKSLYTAQHMSLSGMDGVQRDLAEGGSFNFDHELGGFE